MKTETNLVNEISLFDLFYRLIYEYFFSKIPYSPGVKFRKYYFHKFMNKVGVNGSFSTDIKLISPKGIEIGDNVGIARDVILDGRGTLIIGNNTIIGLQSMIITSTHNYNSHVIPIREQGMYSSPIIIGSDCWIGARAILLPGITIGDSCIIGANSVVTKDIPPHHIAGGVPCKIIRDRRGEDNEKS